MEPKSTYFDTAEVRQIRERLAALQGEMTKLVADFAQLTDLRLVPSYRVEPVVAQKPPTEEAAPREKNGKPPREPKPLHQSELNRAAAYRYMNGTMPSWLPVISEADRKKISRAVLAFSAASGEAPKAEMQLQPPTPTKAKDAAEFGALLPKAGEPWTKGSKPKAKRLSFKGALDVYRKTHGEEVVHYVLTQMLGDQRTAHALHLAMTGFLGTFSPAEAGAAFAKAHKRTVKSEGDAIRQLAQARHKIEHPDGRVTLWSACVKPGDVGAPEKTEPAAAAAAP